jgi:trimethylamine---corrinoid protein Co-methyltransferase
MRNPLKPFDYLSPDEVETIHENSLMVLEKFGIQFNHAEAIDLLERAGARVDRETNLVKFPRQLVLENIAKAPAKFSMRARNRQNDVCVGGDGVVCAPVYGPPFVHDLEGGRREATMEDFRNFVKLGQSVPQIGNVGGTLVEPSDEPQETRHLDMVYALIKYSDKTFMGSVTSAENARDTLALASILFGGREAIMQTPAVIVVVNVNSPRLYDTRMLEALLEYAKARQPVLVSPFSSAGAMSPPAMGGTLVQLNAEVLAGVTLTQLVSPGTPVVYGAFLMITDMQSGSPALGTPETAAGHFVCAQLARRYHLPFRAGGALCCSKLPDGQAMYESMMSLWPTFLSGTNFVLHAAGWLDAGLVASYEKFVMDVELVRMMEAFLKGIPLDAEGLALDAFEEVGPGGHYLGAAHTLRHYRDAFYRPLITDLKNFEEWEKEGALTADRRAAAVWKEWLDEYQIPPLDPALDEALQEYVNRRKAEIMTSNPS